MGGGANIIELQRAAVAAVETYRSGTAPWQEMDHDSFPCHAASCDIEDTPGRAPHDSPPRPSASVAGGTQHQLRWVLSRYVKNGPSQRFVYFRSQHEHHAVLAFDGPVLL